MDPSKSLGDQLRWWLQAELIDADWATAGFSNCIQFSNGVIVLINQSLLKKQVSQHRFSLLPLDLHFHDCTGCWHVRTKDSIEVFASGDSVFSTSIRTECDGCCSVLVRL